MKKKERQMKKEDIVKEQECKCLLEKDDAHKVDVVRASTRIGDADCYVDNNKDFHFFEEYYCKEHKPKHNFEVRTSFEVLKLKVKDFEVIK